MGTVDTASFYFGVFYGFITAGIIGSILNQIRVARAERRRQNLPLDHFPDSAQPNMTSFGVVRFSHLATLRLFGWSILLIGFIGLSTAGLFYISL